MTTAHQNPQSPFSQTIHRVVVQKAVELAFRRYLGELHIPVNSARRKSFSEPDAVDLVLSGRCVDIVPELLDDREMIRRVQSEPGILLNSEALVPSEQVVGELPGEQRMFVFAYVTGLVTANWSDIHKAHSMGQPIYFIRQLPNEWSKPKTNLPLGQIVFKAEGEQTIQLTIGGQAMDGQVLSEQVELAAGQRVKSKYAYNTLAYLHPEQEPAGRIGLTSPLRKIVRLVSPGEWGNCWVYGMDIYLGGFITHAEFSRRSRRLSPGSRIRQTRRLIEKARMLSVRELHPLSELLASKY